MQRPPFPSDDCPLPEVGVTADAAGPFRPIPRCDPPVENPISVFEVAPPAVVTTSPQVRLPAPIQIFSLAGSATCSDWPAYAEGTAPTGNTVTVEAGAFLEELVLQNLEIPDADLYYAAEVIEAQADVVRDLILDGEVESLARLLNLSEALAALIVAEAEAIRARLAEQVQTAAIAALSCSWSNVEQTVSCPEGAVEIEGTNPSVVEAGTYFSVNSQEEADALALAAAEANLFCRYVNEEITVVCSDLDPSKVDLDPGMTTQEIGDSANLDPARTFRNQYTVDAGLFSSETSVEDANEQAYAFALTFLSCFYIQQDPITVACGLDASDIPAYENAVIYDGTSRGNPVTVPAKYVSSDTSLGDAADVALALAQASLDCLWGNQTLVYSCDDKDSDTSSPTEVALHTTDYLTPCGDLEKKEPISAYLQAFQADAWFYAIPSKSANYSVTVTANEFFSAEGTAAANEQAAVYAVSQLSCTYCNPEIDANCPVPGEESGLAFAANHTVRVPGIPYERDETDGSWKPSASVCSIPDSYPTTFCGPDPFTVAAQADTLGTRAYRDVITVETACTYRNRDTWVACQEETLSTAPTTWQDVSPVTGLPYTVDTVREAMFDAGTATMGAGHTSDLVYVPAGTFVAEDQVLADQMAVAFGFSQLDCFWDNSEKIQDCLNPDDPGPSIHLGGELLSTIVIPEGSYHSYLSKADADQQAELAALASLTCVYCNEAVTTEGCPELFLEECTVLSGVSTADATAKANSLLATILGVLQDCSSGSGADGGGGDGDGSNDSGGGGSNDTGSDKSTAIVPASWETTGYTALFIHEMPEVRFDDVLRVPIRGPVTRVPLDFRFVEVCEAGSILVDSAVGDTGPVRCARVEGALLTVEVNPEDRPNYAVVRLTGIRRGFAGMRFPSRTRQQFVDNEAFINSAYKK